jgi:hypothetical protein
MLRPLQKRQLFLWKSSGPMMFDLILDGMNGFWQLRDAHTESAITLLSAKVVPLSKSLVNPSRWSSLYQLNGFGDGNCGCQWPQQINVVCNPADASGRVPCTVLFGNSAQEWPEPFPQLRVQHRGTLFGAEDTMNIERARGVGHGRLHFGISNTKTLFY